MGRSCVRRYARRHTCDAGVRHGSVKTRGAGLVQDNASEVTAAGIARLAGVGRAAVSNWRRRHDDFPKPVGGSDTSPTYELAAVERWLREQGKLPSVPLYERLWQRADSHPDGVPAALRV